jgi:hypothetical protein
MSDAPVIPKTCPECGSDVQSTPLTPPDEGVAIGCTRCSFSGVSEESLPEGFVEIGL